VKAGAFSRSGEAAIKAGGTEVRLECGHGFVGFEFGAPVRQLGGKEPVFSIV
jgi:hypothetical protein